MRLSHLMLCFAALMLGACPAAKEAWPTNYSGSHDQIVDAASHEGELTIWSVTDSQRVQGLLAGFHRLYPAVKVRYVELKAKELYSNFLIDAQTGQGTPDFLWSSAMDMQIKLVNDGYSQPYRSPEIASLPDWAVWKNEAWGTTAEPIVFAYNRRLMQPGWIVPETHSELVRFLNLHADALRGKIATYDPAVSAVGYLYLAQDREANHNTWDLVSAMGAAGVQLYPATEDILSRLADRRLAFAYDMIGSYALEAQAHNPDVGVVVPRDYTLVMSRIAIIPKGARHPNAARLFLDYLLSREGQAHLAEQYMTPVRTDFPMPSAMRLNQESARAIRVGPALLVHQDTLTRRKFLNGWSQALSRQ